MRVSATHNPNGARAEELPVIYGFNNGPSWGPNDLEGALLAEDGTYLGGHICSGEGYMPHDLGISEGSRPDRHEDFRKHYPNGYRMQFVRGGETGTHAGLLAAMEANRKNNR